MFVDNRSFLDEKLFNRRTVYLTSWPLMKYVLLNVFLAK